MTDRKPTHTLTTATVKRFHWRDGFDWAVVILDDTNDNGIVLIHCSWGGWTYMWPKRARGERYATVGAFLVSANYDYLCNKLAPEREYDLETTRQTVARAILDLRRDSCGSMDAERAREEWSLIHDVDSVESWLAQTRIVDAWEMVSKVNNRQFTAFYKTCWDALHETLIAELWP